MTPSVGEPAALDRGRGGAVARGPALVARQAVDDRLQHRRRQHDAEERHEERAARVVDAEFAHAPEAVGADERRPRVQPGPEVAAAVQVEAMQAEAAADEREPGRDGARSRPTDRRGGRRQAGAVAAPGPRCRCMTTTSSQRSNFQPAAAMRAGVGEAERPVHADRAAVLRIADHGQHLARAGGLAAGEQLGEQEAAVAAAGLVGGQVDRVFQAEAIRRPGPELVRIGVAADRRRLPRGRGRAGPWRRRRRGGAPCRRRSADRPRRCRCRGARASRRWRSAPAGRRRCSGGSGLGSWRARLARSL